MRRQEIPCADIANSRHLMGSFFKRLSGKSTIKSKCRSELSRVRGEISRLTRDLSEGGTANTMHTLMIIKQQRLNSIRTIFFVEILLLHT